MNFKVYLRVQFCDFFELNLELSNLTCLIFKNVTDTNEVSNFNFIALRVHDFYFLTVLSLFDDFVLILFNLQGYLNIDCV